MILTLTLTLIQYADDTIMFLEDENSVRRLIRLLKTFGDFSRLKVNKEKSDAMWLGSKRHSNKQPLGVRWTKNPIRLLGVYVSYAEVENNKENVEEKMIAIKKIINMWKSRNLTLVGRIQIIKTFLISKFSYFWSNCYISGKSIQELNKIVFSFIWNGKREKIKRDKLVQDYEKGGLKAPHVESILMTSRISWIKRYLKSKEKTWKSLWDYNMKTVFSDAPELFFKCNFDADIIKKLNITSFYKEII